MNRTKLSFRVFGLIFFIFVFNYLAMKFHWYSLIHWLDILMHFLGGFWLVLSVSLFMPRWEKTTRFIAQVFLCVLLIAVFWEVFELVLNAKTTMNPIDFVDISSDLLADLLGACLAMVYFFKRIMRDSIDTI